VDLTRPSATLASPLANRGSVGIAAAPPGAEGDEHERHHAARARQAGPCALDQPAAAAADIGAPKPRAHDLRPSAPTRGNDDATYWAQPWTHPNWGVGHELKPIASRSAMTRCPACAIIRDTGRISFHVQYTIGKSRPYLKIGDVLGTTVEQARKLALTILSLAKQGIDLRVDCTNSPSREISGARDRCVELLPKPKHQIDPEGHAVG
jgi:hypothetical protein